MGFHMIAQFERPDLAADVGAARRGKIVHGFFPWEIEEQAISVQDEPLPAAAGAGPWLSGDRSRHRDIGGAEQHVVAGARYILSRGSARRVCSGGFQRFVIETCWMVQFQRADQAADVCAVRHRKIVHGFSL